MLGILKKLTGDKLFYLMKPYMGRQVLVLILSILGSVLSLQFPIIFKIIIDDVIPSKNMNRLFGMLLLYIGLSILGYCFSFFTQYILTVTVELFSYNLKKKVYSHLHSLPMTFFNKTPIGEIISSFNADVGTISQFLTKNFLVIINDVLAIIVIAVMLMLLNMKLALICFAIMPFFFLTTMLTKRMLKKRFEIIRNLITEENKLFQNAFTNMKLIKLFVLQKKSMKNFITLQKKTIQERIKNSIIGSLLGQGLSVVTLTAPILILGFGTNMIYHSEFTIGGLMAFLTYIGKLFAPLNDLVGINIQFQNFSVSLERIMKYLDISPEKHIASKYRIERGNISYNSVSFSYDSKPVFKGINLTIDEGEKVALVGRNGCGKTTLVNLLLKLYEINDGSILVDGVDIKEYSTRYLRKNIGIVTQEMSFFNMTIEDNLKMSNYSCTDEEMVRACKISGAYDFICSLKDGFKTVIGERGVNLSGGQLQKLAITRLILKQPKIIIFDEAASSLDYGSSSLLYSLFDSIFKDTTVIYITHDIENLVHADKIVLIGNEKVLGKFSAEEIRSTPHLLDSLKENIA